MKRRSPLFCALATTTCMLLLSTAQANPRVRVGHFAPFGTTLDTTSVTVRVNGANTLTNVRFGDATGYLQLPAAGDYLLEVLPSGTSTVAISARVNLAANTDYSVLAIGDGVRQPLELLPLNDSTPAPSAGNLKLRVVHAAPFANTLDATRVSIRTDGGAVVGGLSDVPYKGASGFLELPAASYNLKVATPTGSRNLIDLAPVNLPAGALATVVAIGNGVSQGLGAFAFPLGRLSTEKAVDQTPTGAWFTPATTGQGFTFVGLPSEDRIWGTWYAFDPNGNQVWFTFDSCGAGTVAAPCATPGAAVFEPAGTPVAIFQTSGGRFNAGIATTQAIGTGRITFTSCNAATFQFSLPAPLNQGTLSLSRLSAAVECAAF